MRATALLHAAALGLALGWAACSDSSPSSPAADGAAQAAPAQSAAAPAPPTSEARGRPLPNFEGAALDGSPLAIRKFLGRRALLFGFNPEVSDASLVRTAVAAVAMERARYNFEIVGFSMGSTVEKTQAFLKEASLEIPTFFDPDGSFNGKLGLQSNVWVLIADADGQLIDGSTYFASEGPDPAATVEGMLRGYLRIPQSTKATPDDLADRPLAPDFSAPRLGGGAPFQLASLRGKPFVLIFFLHTCPHCHDALNFLKAELAKLPAAKRPPLVGISVSPSEYAVKDQLERDGLDFFPVVFDPDVKIRSAYGALQGVPVLLLVDGQGRIVSRTEGWNNEREPPLAQMRLAKLVGETPPMLLSQGGFSGNEFCAVCHESEASTWQLTNHATAMNTLVRQGADGRSECVVCHSVGYGQPGGYSIARPQRSLEDVGCETCHGRGGPHLSPNHLGPNHDYEKVCATCHTPEHSLGFSYASFLPRVSHAANAQFAGLSPDARRRLIEERHRARSDLLPSAAAFVGSEACASCHAKEYGLWQKHPHAASLATLVSKGEAGNAECLRCHVTGLARPGGFPPGGNAKTHPALASVGCESCHGPGGDHVKEGAQKRGTITSLADKCGSCAILQVCGTCHDDANDPGFEFHVKEKIEHQRHSDRPLTGLVSRALPTGTVVGLLGSALRAES